MSPTTPTLPSSSLAKIEALEKVRAEIGKRYIDAVYANKDWQEGMKSALSYVTAEIARARAEG